ncbi:MAG: hypothetical protein JXA69_13730 [Phycisphaerae bacterium]|nr:hypothetical protein [Phycisphaerae bacterium]
MTRTASTNAHPALSDVGFHGYLLLIAKMDSEWGRRCTDPQEYPLLDNHLQMRENCLALGEGINENYERWRKSRVKRPQAAYLDPYLFNPMSFFPIGHADDACLVLTDDHPSAHHLTMRISRKIEDIWLAACPRVAELTAKTRFERAPTGSLFLEPHQLFDVEHGPKPERIKRSDCDLKVHAIQRENPFVAFIRCRMDGLACVRHFLLAQQAIYKSLIRSAYDVLANLSAYCDSDDRPPGQLLSTKDLDTVRLCLLDLQGLEEIGVLAFCRNVSVAASLAERFRGLKYWHLFGQEGDLRRLYEEDPCLRLIARQSLGVPDLTGAECVKKVAGNHVFRWTNTSIAVAPQVLAQDDRTNCNGLLHLSTRWQAKPGHARTVEACVKGMPVDAKSKLWGSFPLGSVDVIEAVEPECESDSRESVLEAQDCIGGNASSRPYVRVETVLGELKERARRLIRDAWCVSKTPSSSGNHWVDFIADLEAPVPPTAVVFKDDTERNTLEHHAVLEKVLSAVQMKLWPRLPSIAARIVQTEDDGLPLSMHDLCRHMRLSGLPTGLCHTIESLYQMFFTLLGDALRFDVALDLYDAFAALHRLLTKVLYAMTHPEARREDEHRMLDRARVHQIEKFVEALDDALRHRTNKLYASEGPLDMAVDFRGGLNQVLLAASAPILCSVGLFRRCLVEPELAKHNVETQGLDRGEVRSSVGVVSRVSLRSGLASAPVSMGWKQVGMPQLASFRADTSHYFHFASQADYLHETGHLIFRNVFQRDVLPGLQDGMLADLWRLQESDRLEDRRRFQAVSRRLDEVFAMFFSHVFLFESECVASMMNTMALFARSLESVAEPDAEGHTELDAMQRFFEVGLRLFLVRLLLPEQEQTSIASWLDASPPEFPGPVVDTRFLEFLDMVGPCHPDYVALMGKGRPLRKSLRAHAREVFKEGRDSLGKYLPWVFKTVGMLHRNYRRIPNVPDPEDARFDVALKEAVKGCLKQGRPIVRNRLRPDKMTCEKPSIDGALPEALDDPYVDSLYLITRCLKQYIMTIKDAKGKRIILDRGHDSVHIRYPGDGEPWWEFQIDRGAAQLFCPVPQSRRDRTRKQIALRKTLRDITATLQGRRLYRLVYDALQAEPRRAQCPS